MAVAVACGEQHGAFALLADPPLKYRVVATEHVALGLVADGDVLLEKPGHHLVHDLMMARREGCPRGN
ncbi:hypothetical protein [Nocardioides sp. SYSU DS0651]|uniref:hypothetical protein n=1 Tax=Nocardioides sp. SYSU DS0651 TaxID=3415955 RepID=UPI003F4C4B60